MKTIAIKIVKMQLHSLQIRTLQSKNTLKIKSLHRECYASLSVKQFGETRYILKQTTCKINFSYIHFFILKHTTSENYLLRAEIFSEQLSNKEKICLNFLEEKNFYWKQKAIKKLPWRGHKKSRFGKT